MGNFRNDNRSNNRDRGRGGQRSGGRDSGRGFDNRGSRGPVTMHKTTCDECGESCEVPFKPSGDKPVYCSDCFGGSRSSDRGQRRSDNRRDFGGRGSDRQMHKVICDECGESCEVPFKPSGDKPVYCSDCFEASGGRDGSRGKQGGLDNKQLVEQLNALNNKIDKLIAILAPDLKEEVSKSTPEAKKEEVAKEEKKEKEEKKTATKKKLVAKKATEEKEEKKPVIKKKATTKRTAKKKATTKKKK